MCAREKKNWRDRLPLFEGEPPAEIITVADLCARLKGVVERELGNVAVAGEISAYHFQSASGHRYFSLKDGRDSRNLVQCVLFRGAAGSLSFEPEEGQAVVVRGRVTAYTARSQFQIIASSIQLLGQGALQLAFERLKRKLLAEGLFDADHKKPLPFLPARIAVITSREGAALRDVLSVIDRRFGAVHVRVLPVPVQGKEAAPRIARALAALNRDFPDTDVLILTRGGGSPEDLWAFNTEEVARAVFHSRIPVISAVGHEIDTTICDFAADARAATPSAAAEVVLPDRLELEQRLTSGAQRLARALRAVATSRARRLEGLWRGPAFRRPADMLRAGAQRCDDLAGRLSRAARVLAGQAGRRVDALGGRLEAGSPLAILARGYSITSRDGIIAPLRSPRGLQPGDVLKTRFADGQARSRVVEVQEDPAHPAPTSKPGREPRDNRATET